MKLSIVATLILVLAESQALCAEMVVPSKVDMVDLHPDSAEITRLAHCKLPLGDTLVILHGVSPRLVEQSLRISGIATDGVSIRSVTTRRLRADTISTKTSQEQALIDEQQDLLSRLQALRKKQGMILKVADAQPSLALGSSGSEQTAEFWSSIWTKVEDGLQDADHRIRETQKRLDVVHDMLKSASTLDQASPSAGGAYEVLLELSADHDVETDLKIVYQTNAASWHPFYDARLRTDGPQAQLDLVKRARVVQSSGEDWTNVGLTLSTSQLSVATDAPSLTETHDPTGANRDGITRGALLSSFVPGSASSDANAVDANFQIPGRVNVANGERATLYDIGSRSMDADMSVKAVPIADKHAYLEAKFENKESVPLISGDVELYRDGNFVGRTTLAGTAPGDRVTIGFGVDELVSVERVDEGRKERNTTVEAGVSSVERAFKTVVTNRHPFPVRIEVDDREPAFNNVAIVFKERPDTTAPTDRMVDGHRGVLAWTYLYAPGQTRAFTLAWRVRWPAKLGPIQGAETTQFFRFTGGTSF